MQAILGQSEDESVQAVEQAAKSFARLVRERCPSCDGGPAIIVRAGALGSYTVSDSWSGWVPAYWSAAEQNKVVDVTGGGNSYLGGLCAGLLLTDGDWRAGEILPVVTLVFDASVDLCVDSCIVCDTTEGSAALDAPARARVVERRRPVETSTGHGQPGRRAGASSLTLPLVTALAVYDLHTSAGRLEKAYDVSNGRSEAKDVERDDIEAQAQVRP